MANNYDPQTDLETIIQGVAGKNVRKAMYELFRYLIGVTSGFDVTQEEYDALAESNQIMATATYYIRDTGTIIRNGAIYAGPNTQPMVVSENDE